MDLSEPGCKQLPSAKLNHSAEPCLESTGPTFRNTTMCEPSPQKDSRQMEFDPTLFAEASHARTLVSQGRVLGYQVKEAGYGLNCTESLKKPIRNTLLSKMLAPFVLADWTRFCGRLLRSGMTRNGTVFPLQPLAALTDGIGSGLLPTPCAREGRDWSRASILAKLDKCDGVAKRICNLSQKARFQNPICGLNPSFAEVMMGYPEGWTELAQSVTPFTQESPKSSGAQSCKPK